ncbi:hypothetical protein SLA2020_462500 [Shorea laevis]
MALLPSFRSVITHFCRPIKPPAPVLSSLLLSKRLSLFFFPFPKPKTLKPLNSWPPLPSSKGPSFTFKLKIAPLFPLSHPNYQFPLGLFWVAESTLAFKKDERLVGSMHVSAILMIMKNGYNVKSMAILIPESNSKRFACNDTFFVYLWRTGY